MKFNFIVIKLKNLKNKLFIFISVYIKNYKDEKLSGLFILLSQSVSKEMHKKMLQIFSFLLSFIKHFPPKSA